MSYLRIDKDISQTVDEVFGAVSYKCESISTPYESQPFS